MCPLQLLLVVNILAVSMLVAQYQTQNFRQKKMAKETRNNVGSILPTTKRKTSRCLVQGQKQCGKILKGNFATNLKKHQISTSKNLKNVTQQRKPGELTVPAQEERARHLHHNYKKQ